MMTQGENINILLTSAGKRSYLVDYFKQELQGLGKVFVTNSTSAATSFQEADEAFVSPLIYDPQYIPFLLRLVEEHEIKIVIPLFDIDLPVLARHKEEFLQRGARVIVSEESVTHICNDKWETYQYLCKMGLLSPQTFLSVEDVTTAVRQGELSYPVMVKPRWGMGSIGVYEADNEQELIVLHKKVENKIHSTYLKYEAAQSSQMVIIQEKICGQEYGLDIINDLEGQYRNTSIKLKYNMQCGETDSAITVDHTGLSKLGEKIGTSLKHIGNLDVDVIETEKGDYVIDMNARFGGGYPFSHLAGVNLPRAIILWCKGEEVLQELLTPRVNILGQKDRRPVRLSGNADEIRERIENNLEKISESISRLEKYLPVSLTERNIDIVTYSEKLSEKGFVILLEEKDNTVAIAAGYANDLTKYTAYLSLLIVSREYQNMHYGSKMLRRFESVAREKHMKKIRLQVRKYNPQAILFYKSMNYEIECEAEADSYYMMKEI